MPAGATACSMWPAPTPVIFGGPTLPAKFSGWSALRGEPGTLSPRTLQDGRRGRCHGGRGRGRDGPPGRGPKVRGRRRGSHGLFRPQAGRRLTAVSARAAGPSPDRAPLPRERDKAAHRARPVPAEECAAREGHRPANGLASEPRGTRGERARPALGHVRARSSRTRLPGATGARSRGGRGHWRSGDTAPCPGALLFCASCSQSSLPPVASALRLPAGCVQESSRRHSDGGCDLSDHARPLCVSASLGGNAAACCGFRRGVVTRCEPTRASAGLPSVPPPPRAQLRHSRGQRCVEHVRVLRRP